MANHLLVLPQPDLRTQTVHASLLHVVLVVSHATPQSPAVQASPVLTTAAPASAVLTTAALTTAAPASAVLTTTFVHGSVLAWPSGSVDNASAFVLSLVFSSEAFEPCPCAFETRPPTGLARRGSAATAETAATCTPADLARRGAAAAAATPAADPARRSAATAAAPPAAGPARRGA